MRTAPHSTAPVPTSTPSPPAQDPFFTSHCAPFTLAAPCPRASQETLSERHLDTICSKKEGTGLCPPPPNLHGAEHKPHPAVVVSVDDLGRDGFGVTGLRPHLLPQSIVLGDIHQLILDVFPIEDSGYLALLGFDLEAGRERRVTGSWRGARRAGTHPSVPAALCNRSWSRCSVGAMIQTPPGRGARPCVGRRRTPSAERWIRCSESRGGDSRDGSETPTPGKRGPGTRSPAPAEPGPPPPPLTSREPVTEVL